MTSREGTVAGSDKKTGKVAIVTGAGRGIGRAIALRLAREGCDVLVADLDLAGAAQYGEELGAATVSDEIIALGQRSVGFQGDLCERSTARDMVARAIEAFGRVDILVNNCGGAFTPIERSKASVMPDEDLASMLQINLYSAIFCCQEVLPAMRAQGGGSIVNMASRAGVDPAARDGRLTPYGLAKTGVIQYTRFLAHDVGPDNIRVNCLAPGTIFTARIKQLAQLRGLATDADLQEIPLRRFGTPDEVASVVEFFASDRSSFVTGQCLSVCGGNVLTPS
ncbi:3-oxoacyl-ACP reductase FabG [soil metagenome]